MFAGRASGGRRARRRSTGSRSGNSSALAGTGEAIRGSEWRAGRGENESGAGDPETNLSDPHHECRAAGVAAAARRDRRRNFLVGVAGLASPRGARRPGCRTGVAGFWRRR
jgi:hypothetical protein